MRGMVNERLPSPAAAASNVVGVQMHDEELTVVPHAEARLFVDTVATAKVAPAPLARADGTEAYVAALIGCPAQILAAVRTRHGSVDPRW